MSWRLMHSRAKTRWRRGGEPALRQLAPRSPWPGGGTAWGGAARQVAGDGPPRRPTRRTGLTSWPGGKPPERLRRASMEVMRKTLKSKGKPPPMPGLAMVVRRASVAAAAPEPAG